MFVKGEVLCFSFIEQRSLNLKTVTNILQLT